MRMGLPLNGIQDCRQGLGVSRTMQSRLIAVCQVPKTQYTLVLTIQ